MTLLLRTPLEPPPDARFRDTTVYDQATNRMTIFGGEVGCGGGLVNDVWVLSNINGLGARPHGHRSPQPARAVLYLPVPGSQNGNSSKRGQGRVMTQRSTDPRGTKPRRPRPRWTRVLCWGAIGLLFSSSTTQAQVAIEAKLTAFDAVLTPVFV